MIAAAVDVWRRALPQFPRRVTRVVRVGTREQLPARLHPRRLYLIGDPAKWAVLHCPCGHNHDIDLNLLNPARPRWTVSTSPAGRPTLRPSVDVRGSRRCHFWLRDGDVDWCRDRGDQSRFNVAGRRRPARPWSRRRQSPESVGRSPYRGPTTRSP